MNIRAASLVFVFAFASLPAHAQDLEARVTALENAVAKLNGQITSDDLVGTYTLTAFQNELVGGFPAQIASYVFVGTVTLAADGTTSYSATNSGHRLIEGSPWSRVLNDGSGQGTLGNWTYANGTVTTSDLPLSVAAAGRVLIGAGANHADGTDVLLIFTRLL